MENLTYVTPLWGIRKDNLIWKIQVPSRLKSFIWRLGRNCIPARENLQGESMKFPTMCVFYDKEIITIQHTFFKSPNSEKCLKETCVWNFVDYQLVHSDYLLEFLVAVMESLNCSQIFFLAFGQCKTNILGRVKLIPQSTCYG